MPILPKTNVTSTKTHLNTKAIKKHQQQKKKK